MAFWAGLTSAFTGFGGGSALGKGLIGGATSGIMGEAFTRFSGGRRRREHMQFGRQRNMLEMEQFNNLQALGLTPQEIIGSTGAGAYGSDAGQFGNGQAAQATAQMMQAKMQQDTQLEAVAMQANSARDVALINAGVQARGQDITEMLGVDRLELDNERLEWQKFTDNWSLTQKQAALDADLPLKDKRWLLHMKMLTMGVNNVIASGIVAHLKQAGFDILDPASSTKTAAEIIMEALEISGTTVKQVGAYAGEKISEGAREMTDEVIKIFQGIWSGAKEVTSKPEIFQGRGMGGFSQPLPPPPAVKGDEWNSPHPPPVVE